MEISNKTLALFLIAAIVVSVAGTILSLDRLGRISTTGYATDTAIANVTIQTVASIVFVIDVIDFGTGSVDTSGGNQQCNLTINSSSTISKSGCTSFNAANSAGDTFIIENDGNKFLNVTLNSTSNSTDLVGGNATLALFQYAVSNNESSSCAGTIGTGGWTNFNKVDTNICTNLSFQTASDSLRVGIRMGIPYDSLTGVRTTTLTVTGTEFA